jgi:hypothetical protein
MTETLAVLSQTAKRAVREAFPNLNIVELRNLWLEPRPEFDGSSLQDLYMSDADDLRRIIAWAAEQ